MQTQRHSDFNKCGLWPALVTQRDDRGAWMGIAADPTARARARYGRGRVWQMAHRVELATDGGRGQGRAQIDVDAWTGDVLRVRYELSIGGDEVAVQECGSFADHEAALFKMALRVGRALGPAAGTQGQHMMALASALERRCSDSLRTIRSAMN